MSPGQGAQRPGLLTPWLQDRNATAQLEQLNECVEFDLFEAGTQWDAQRLRNTRVAQPVIFAASLVAATSALNNGARPTAVTGHSVGEWCAAVIAGVLTATEAMRLVAARGNAMALACDEEPTGLSAVLGGERADVLETATSCGLALANDNGPSQVVVGGTLDQLRQLEQLMPTGARVRSLDVAGAFHTEAMHPAVAMMTRLAIDVPVADAQVPLISNRDGSAVTNGRQILDRLVDQIALPVRWDLVMQTLSAIETSVTVETCPSGTLTGIVRRALPHVVTHRVDSPADAESARSANLRSVELTGANR